MTEFAERKRAESAEASAHLLGTEVHSLLLEVEHLRNKLEAAERRTARVVFQPKAIVYWLRRIFR